MLKHVQHQLECCGFFIWILLRHGEARILSLLYARLGSMAMGVVIRAPRCGNTTNLTPSPRSLLRIVQNSTTFIMETCLDVLLTDFSPGFRQLPVSFSSTIKIPHGPR